MMQSGQCVLPRSPGAAGFSGASPIGTSIPAMWQSGVASEAMEASSDETSGHSAVHAIAAIAKSETRRLGSLIGRILAWNLKPSLAVFSAMKKGLMRLRDEWPGLSLYQRFESLVAAFLSVLVGVVVLVALYRLSSTVIVDLVIGVLNPLDPQVFQTIFGDILTLLIALEFNHSLQLVVSREQSLIQTKVVLLIALVALARKFIVMDIKEATAGLLFGLAAMALALGAVYWLMRERDDRLAADSKRSSG